MAAVGARARARGRVWAAPAGGAGGAGGRRLALRVEAKQSLIGKQPVAVPKGVDLKLSGQTLSVKVPKPPSHSRRCPPQPAHTHSHSSAPPPAAPPRAPRPQACTGSCAAPPCLPPLSLHSRVPVAGRHGG